MAKKKASQRLRATTPDDLLEKARVLTKYADRLKTFAKALDKTEEKSADIEGYKMLDRGLDEVEKFIANCQKKIREFR